MIKLNIKPLSVNEAWQGKRFKTAAYNAYEKHLLLIMSPNLGIGKISKDDKISIEIEFGFASKLSDIDNPVKCFFDVLCKKYGFDDRQIFSFSVEKKEVKKGQDYIKFKISKTNHL